MINKIETQLDRNKKLIKSLEKENKVLIAMLAEYKSWPEVTLYECPKCGLSANLLDTGEVTCCGNGCVTAVNENTWNNLKRCNDE